VWVQNRQADSNHVSDGDKTCVRPMLEACLEDTRFIPNLDYCSASLVIVVTFVVDDWSEEGK
jgi:hypothetical protein